ncbi:MAG TPA: ECF-type sigma factor [Vicinamibacteria bacterium]|nr:ECF-type sigma factor [Vicinamibacteria bacterium]
MSSAPSKPISELLVRWRDGDQGALQALLPLVYDELKRLARNYLRNERPGHTLQSTALVHEAYLRLVQSPLQLQNRTHFFAVAARLMREILVDHARSRRAAKRDYRCKITLDRAVALPQKRDVDLLALDDALDELSRLDPRQGRIVELRFFGGLSIDETSEILGISPATVKREWTTARAWLHREMSGGAARP